jgi:hypothetical protein
MQHLTRDFRRAAFTMFLEDADTMRLMVYLDGKDLVAVRCDVYMVRLA